MIIIKSTAEKVQLSERSNIPNISKFQDHTSKNFFKMAILNTSFNLRIFNGREFTTSY